MWVWSGTKNNLFWEQKEIENIYQWGTPYMGCAAENLKTYNSDILDQFITSSPLIKLMLAWTQF